METTYNLTNLWEETVSKLETHGKTWDEVIAVQTEDIRISKERFEELAKATNYDSGYGTEKIIEGLVLIGDNWWYTRGEYDGAEWWEFHTIPKVIEYDKAKELKIKSLETI